VALNVLVVCLDITRAQRSPRRRSQLVNRELEQLVSSGTAKLETANKELDSFQLSRSRRFFPRSVAQPSDGLQPQSCGMIARGKFDAGKEQPRSDYRQAARNMAN